MWIGSCWPYGFADGKNCNFCVLRTTIQEAMVAIAKRVFQRLFLFSPPYAQRASGRSFSGHRPRRRCRRLCSTHLSVSQCGSGNEAKILRRRSDFEFEETGARKDRGERRKRKEKMSWNERSRGGPLPTTPGRQFNRLWKSGANFWAIIFSSQYSYLSCLYISPFLFDNRSKTWANSQTSKLFFFHELAKIGFFKEWRRRRNEQDGTPINQMDLRQRNGSYLSKSNCTTWRHLWPPDCSYNSIFCINLPRLNLIFPSAP